MHVFILFMFLVITVSARLGYGPNEQDWGFVKVRDKAHMFWWLHYTTATNNYTDKPLVIWLQGGPGGSSTGIGNFYEIGPWDINQKNREFSWTKYLNVLFVDNPVGTGYSYVEDPNDMSLFAANNSACASDFIVLLKGFFSENPQFRAVPLYIFGQSYGGKMTVDIALELNKQIKAGNINCNFRGIGLGDAWISPIDSLMGWPIYLLNLGFVDTEEYDILKNAIDTAKSKLDAGDFGMATNYFKVLQKVINTMSSVDFYNVLKERKVTSNMQMIKSTSPDFDNTETFKNVLEVFNIDYSHLQTNLSTSPDFDNTETFKNVLEVFNIDYSHLQTNLRLQDHEDIDSILKDLMNGPVIDALGLGNIPFEWGNQSELVFRAMHYDFMKPVTDTLETILNSTNIEITVYNGQLDLIVNTPGTLAWVNKLKWPKAAQWKNANKTHIIIDNITEGYSKSFGNFNFYWINRAGHAVPTDNPKTMKYVLFKSTLFQL